MRSKFLSNSSSENDKEKYSRIVGIELSGDPRAGDFNLFEP